MAESTHTGPTKTETGTWHKTACILCENNCGIQILTDPATSGSRFLKIRGDKDHVSTHGYTCNKALRLDHYQNGAERLSTPLRREADGTFTPIDWDTAIREIAQKFAAVRDTHGGDKIFYYGGGGQGNHLGGAYALPFLRLLGSRYHSSALAQEKTGEAWVDAHLTGGHTHGDFEHAEVSVFFGKNPYQSHGVSRARTVLKEISKDPERSMIVIDPVRTETADLADFHLQVKPGTDAWCLTALIAILFEENLTDAEFIANHTRDVEELQTHFRSVDIGEYAAVCGIEEDLLRRTARRIGTASSVSTYEDLGVQQNLNSTLISYLNKLIWLLTGNFGKQGGMHPHSLFAPLAKYTTEFKHTPVTGARMAVGMVPPNVIAEEILTDHPDRFRAMLIESSNPAHSLADSTTFRAALDALELVVVIDVVFTETAQHADYVLPAASQYEKWEATFFNFHFPKNSFHLREPVLDPLPGTLPEPEIYARLIRELGAGKERTLATLRAALRLGRTPFRFAFAACGLLDKDTFRLAPYLVYETLGATLPARDRSTAVVWALAQLTAFGAPKAMKRAGHRSADALYEAVIAGRSGVVFSEESEEDAWGYVPHADAKIPVLIPELLSILDDLDPVSAVHTSSEFPLVLSAGQRRQFTANTIFHNSAWRLKDKNGALRMAPADAEALSLAAGDIARVVTNRGEAVAEIEIDDRMQAGHAALPNGFGLALTDDGAASRRVGVALNELTDAQRRDPVVGTPWHKNVPARVEAVGSGDVAARSDAQSSRVATTVRT
ncbi:molybdopterin oxidoreductase [Williamsia sp. Leaf354]|uniref:molybdopterin-dependent oxidoreductase n=1 Tax=Williamsia sp. Leaf354 TaxID=1736349 RepID=UPI0007004EAB|nr:molybdopterin-dependent oxidoreductase [Williamsia sp. Leaf354]KQS01021.1 molybdopterin oxidoreductase [Williamsia sp. Leaf354]